MPRGPQAAAVDLTAGERAELERLLRRRGVGQALAQRVRIVSACAEPGATNLGVVQALARRQPADGGDLAPPLRRASAGGADGRRGRSTGRSAGPSMPTASIRSRQGSPAKAGASGNPGAVHAVMRIRPQGKKVKEIAKEAEGRVREGAGRVPARGVSPLPSPAAP